MSRFSGKPTDVYSFCESVYAGATSPWHIRRLSEPGLRKLGGGIDGPSLCNSVTRGWDLDVMITEHHLTHSCQRCVELYREAVGETKV